jgi:hypothetical protein
LSRISAALLDEIIFLLLSKKISSPVKIDPSEVIIFVYPKVSIVFNSLLYSALSAKILLFTSSLASTFPSNIVILV